MQEGKQGGQGRKQETEDKSKNKKRDTDEGSSEKPKTGKRRGNNEQERVKGKDIRIQTREQGHKKGATA